MSNQVGNVILGTLVGAAVGFAAGILLAPSKGSKTRGKLSEKGEDLKKSITDAADRAVASLKDLRESAERIVKKSDELKKPARSKANKMDDAFENA